MCAFSTEKWSFSDRLLGVGCFWGFVNQCHKEQRWGSLAFGVIVSLALAVPVGYLIADQLPKVSKSQKNQAWAMLAVLGSIVVNGLPLRVALMRDDLEAGRTDYLRGTQVMKGGCGAERICEVA